ncbi:UDP-3-O-[3-hydroxymyristoyl] N-acetylglucosamine deacetylase [Maritimibacter sp. 55A14]|uniref:UDP-3-O-acyl-N-acetylglucosamine deacetylase n=1 Tax=Maritimibacter sp. 55A14 TaxID=2174844 RepID=UPI000D612062|nr:UDP-3-O-acyl-N-acetylglucosamine deacetylase [Maritimibacter sp. 55A14]PWE34050.1 UDP-3-O-[3-hydroxymyristoyl] N-acetylglucosamine deacetylase [Maritimibacter sp. 55A14]
MQTTLKSSFTLLGTGLHTGQPARMSVYPASAEHGIWFRRTDVTDRDNMIPARFDAVSNARLCTKIFNADGVGVSTIEHLMAALAGCGVHNALIDIDGPEIPVLDGSASRFVREILARGLRRLDSPVRALRILEPVEIMQGESVARLSPCAGFEMDYEIAFEDVAIGRQALRLDLANGAFVRELCDSRTFCRQSDVDAMRAAGLALGGTLDNAVVVDGARIVTPGGMRHPDECVRHKMLDAVGDLALAGLPILGCYTGIRAGHAMTNALLRKLFAAPMSYELVICDAGTVARLPGVGLSFDDLRHVA